MEKLYLFAFLSLMFVFEGSAKHRHHRDMNRSIVVRDTLTLNSLEVINHNGIDSVVYMSEEKIPIYKILTQKNGEVMTPRDWAEFKTENMKHRLHLNNKQTEKLYKLNLMESKERISYGDNKSAMNERHLRKQAKAEERFVETLNPIQKMAYSSMKGKECNHPLSVGCCKMKGHGKKMVVVKQ